MDLWAALMVGVLGSLHCVGMCGPIALALPFHAQKWGHVVLSSTLYNGGRIIGYATIGLFFGLIGQSFSMVGLQKVLSVSIGALILVALLATQLSVPSRWTPAVIQRLYSHLQKGIANGLRRLHSGSDMNDGSHLGQQSALLLGIGYANAFIPCGLVYLAIAGSVTQASIGQGVLFMTFFGIGTLPLMLSLGLSQHLVHPKMRLMIRRLNPLVLLFFAGLFILRGLNIDLPVDLSFWMALGNPPMCH